MTNKKEDKCKCRWCEGSGYIPDYEQMRMYRLGRGVKAAAVAKELLVSPQHISLIETGKVIVYWTMYRMYMEAVDKIAGKMNTRDDIGNNVIEKDTL